MCKRPTANKMRCVPDGQKKEKNRRGCQDPSLLEQATLARTPGVGAKGSRKGDQVAQSGLAPFARPRQHDFSCSPYQSSPGGSGPMRKASAARVVLIPLDLELFLHSFPSTITAGTFQQRPPTTAITLTCQSASCPRPHPRCKRSCYTRSVLGSWQLFD